MQWWSDVEYQVLPSRPLMCLGLTRSASIFWRKSDRVGEETPKLVSRRPRLWIDIFSLQLSMILSRYLLSSNQSLYTLWELTIIETH